MRNIVLSFCRMNPPTIGHQAHIDACKKIAALCSGELYIHLSKSKDKKNPLDYASKLRIIKECNQDIADSFLDIPEVTDPFKMLKHHSQKDGETINLWIVVGDDRLNEFRDKFHKYNGSEFNFNFIVVLSSGVRSKKISGTVAREHIKNDEFAEFSQISMQHEHIEQVFDYCKFHMK